MVDLPDPDRPVNHRQRGCWCLMRARAALSTSTCCQWMLPARRSAKSRVPAATVALVWRSIRMKAPSVAVVGIGLERHRLVEVQVAVGDFVEIEVLGRQVFLGVDVDLVLDLGDRAPTVRAPILSQYGRPGSIGCSPSHSMCAANWSATSGWLVAAAMMSPRLASTSSASVNVIACPAPACARSPSAVTMRATVERSPGRQHRDLGRPHGFRRPPRCRRSRGSSGPAGTPIAQACENPCPACRARLRRPPGARAGSRRDTTASPRECTSMLSPLSADTGMQVTCGMPSCPASSW